MPFSFFNSPFAGKVALELGPAPQVASFFLFTGGNLTENAKIEKVHETGRRESWEALDHTVLHRILVRIQPRGRVFASSRVWKVDFSVFPVDCFFINTAFF